MRGIKFIGSASGIERVGKALQGELKERLRPPPKTHVRVAKVIGAKELKRSEKRQRKEGATAT